MLRGPEVGHQVLAEFHYLWLPAASFAVGDNNRVMQSAELIDYPRKPAYFPSIYGDSDTRGKGFLRTAY